MSFTRVGVNSQWNCFWNQIGKKSDVMYLKVESDVMIRESEEILRKRSSHWWLVEVQLSKIWQHLLLCNVTLSCKVQSVLWSVSLFSVCFWWSGRDGWLGMDIDKEQEDQKTWTCVESSCISGKANFLFLHVLNCLEC